MSKTYALLLIVALVVSPYLVKADTDLMDIVEATPDLATLDFILDETDLDDAVEDTKNITVFAPTNMAFAELLTALEVADAQTLLRESKDDVVSILQYHVVPGIYYAKDLTDGMVLETLLPGATLEVKIDGDKVYIVPTGGPEAMVIQADVAADNGVAHVIDAVLIPASESAETEAPTSG